ncbi:Hypothetical protein NTJ_03843 [Nesidiocoris tenuis]|uniref:Uncharacterized protein n=1 Tax=Nesidiocoris tenuis TaxID=355587 RepID=A0ABN7AJI0_9HEMI|nr:Hypothetical protein NTJ_03843 [Nesidiocoris tenuis]
MCHTADVGEVEVIPQHCPPPLAHSYCQSWVSNPSSSSSFARYLPVYPLLKVLEVHTYNIHQRTLIPPPVTSPDTVYVIWFLPQRFNAPASPG